MSRRRRGQAARAAQTVGTEPSDSPRRRGVLVHDSTVLAGPDRAVLMTEPPPRTRPRRGCARWEERAWVRRSRRWPSERRSFAASVAQEGHAAEVPRRDAHGPDAIRPPREHELRSSGRRPAGNVPPASRKQRRAARARVLYDVARRANPPLGCSRRARSCPSSRVPGSRARRRGVRRDGLGTAASRRAENDGWGSRVACGPIFSGMRRRRHRLHSDLTLLIRAHAS